MSDLKAQLEDVVSRVKDYFGSLNQLEIIAWGVIGLGFILVILGFIFM